MNTVSIFKHSNASLIKIRVYSCAHLYTAPGINKIPEAEVPYLYSNYKRTAIAEEGFLFTNNITSRFKTRVNFCLLHVVPASSSKSSKLDSFCVRPVCL